MKQNQLPYNGRVKHATQKIQYGTHKPKNDSVLAHTFTPDSSQNRADLLSITTLSLAPLSSCLSHAKLAKFNNPHVNPYVDKKSCDEFTINVRYFGLFCDRVAIKVAIGLRSFCDVFFFSLRSSCYRFVIFAIFCIVLRSFCHTGCDRRCDCVVIGLRFVCDRFVIVLRSFCDMKFVLTHRNLSHLYRNSIARGFFFVATRVRSMCDRCATRCEGTSSQIDRKMLHFYHKFVAHRSQNDRKTIAKSSQNDRRSIADRLHIYRILWGKLPKVHRDPHIEKLSTWT